MEINEFCGDKGENPVCSSQLCLEDEQAVQRPKQEFLEAPQDIELGGFVPSEYLKGLVSSLEKIRNVLEVQLNYEFKKYQELREVCMVKLEYEENNDCQLVKVEEDGHLDETSNVGKAKLDTTVNDTKNIPKNFGKAIISFIQRNQKVAAQCLKRHNFELEEFLRELKAKKKCLHSIRELRSLWMEKDFKYAKAFRELSYHFLRKATYKYIFGSRIADFGSHLKYRYRIMKALENPSSFNSIKM